jgi:NADPH:quinone reductase-like Zn-dependent oxidoreductase
MEVWELQAGDGLAALRRVRREPRALGAGDVRVGVRAAALNYRDVLLLRGARTRRAPVVAASDGAGEVLEVGAAVTRWKPGDRVAAAFFPGWQDGALAEHHHAGALGGGQDGLLAEEAVLPESAWVAVPEHLSLEEAATLPCAGVTAYNALFEAARLRPGDVLLVQGTGGVSIFALQLAKAAGARVVLTSQSEEKRERARRLGADHVIDYQQVPRWGEAARDWTGGRGVDVVVEVGGPGTFDQSVAARRYGGTLSVLGVLTGGQGDVNLRAFFTKGLRAHGVYVGSVRTFEALASACAAARLRPVIDRVFGFDEVREAYQHLGAGRHFGKVVVRVA